MLASLSGLGCGARTGLEVDERETMGDASVPPLPDDARVLAVSGSHSCLARSGVVLCWGRNVHGEMGDGTTTDRPTPVRVIGLSDAIALAAGGDETNGHTCALRASGGVACWGANRVGQLGDGSFEERHAPAEVVALTDAIQITAGFVHSCVLRRTGEVVCWGTDYDGQLGDGRSGGDTFSAVPVAVVGVTDAVEVAAAGDHTCVRHREGTVSCWGSGHWGQLGDGEMVHDPTCHRGGCHSVPVAVAGITDAVEISGRCARRAGGDTVCWGSNERGWVGDGTNDTRWSPVVVGGLPDALTLAAGPCAVRRDRSVVCWGANAYGQLGDGTLIARNAPTRVLSLADTVEVAADGNSELGAHLHSCARVRSGGVFCWGQSDFGDLGDGVARHMDCAMHDCSPTPVRVDLP